MDHRGLQLAVFLFWLVATTWLITTKIWPALQPAGAPDQRVYRPESQAASSQIAWRISWNHRPIGQARTVTRRHNLGFGSVESVVRFERLPAQQMARELLGDMGRLLGIVELDDSDLELSFTIGSRMEFDPFGSLQRFRSSVEMESLGELFVMYGRVREGQLELEVLAGKNLYGDSRQAGTSLFKQQFELPPNALVADSLAPQSRLAGLRVGQSWSFRAYRAFPPQNPFRVIEAHVEREEMIGWEDDVEPVKVVSFRDTSGSGLTTSRKPVSVLWVRDDGTVLRQQMQLGNVTVEFTRQPEEAVEHEEP